jgi:hypothetical protein
METDSTNPNLIAFANYPLNRAFFGPRASSTQTIAHEIGHLLGVVQHTPNGVDYDAYYKPTLMYFAYDSTINQCKVVDKDLSQMPHN